MLIKDVYGNELTAVKKTIEEDKQYVTESTDGEKPVTSELVFESDFGGYGVLVED